jgi:hypothetical protein
LLITSISEKAPPFLKLFSHKGHREHRDAKAANVNDLTTSKAPISFPRPLGSLSVGPETSMASALSMAKAFCVFVRIILRLLFWLNYLPFLNELGGCIYKFQGPKGRKIPRIFPKKYQLPAAKIPERLAEKNNLNRQTNKKRPNR